MNYKTLLIFFTILIISLDSLAQKINIENENQKIKELAETNLEQSIQYADSILKLDFSNKTQIKLTNGFLNIQANNYKKAFNLFNSIIDTSKDKRSLAEAYIGCGQAKGLLNNKHEAINYTLKALKIGENLNDPEIKAHSYSLLAYIYYSSSDFVNAIKYSKESVKIQKIRNDNNSLASLYNNISVYFEKNNQLDSAQYYSYKTLNLNKIIGEKYRIAISYNNTAKLLHKKQNFTDAIAYYKKSIQIHDSISSNNINPLINIATLYSETKSFKKASNYYNKAVKIAIKNKDSKNLEKLYSSLLNIAIKEQNFDHSVYYQQKRDSLNKLLLAKENEDKMKLIDNQYKQSLKEQKLQQQLKLKKKNQIIFFILAGFLLFLGLFILQRYRNNQLRLQKEKLVLEQKVLRSQMNPHFIFNALTSIQKNLLESDLLKSSTSLAKFAKLIRQNFEFTNKPLIGLDEDLEALKNYIETQQLRFEDKFDYQINIQKGLDLSFVQIPPMLLQPFVENAIEHGLKSKKEKGNLIINVLKQDKLFHFEIIDDGVGYKEKETENDREHAIDIFINRLKLRNLQEDKSFNIKNLTGKKGTVISFTLKL